MSKVLTFSRFFPAYHPKAGKPTHFVEKIYNGLYSKNNLMDYPVGLEIDDNIQGQKHHTIRSGNRWKVGDKFSPRVWSGKPYASKQITIAPDIEVKKIWNVEVDEDFCIWVFSGNESNDTTLDRLAQNDGLSLQDLLAWFNKPMIGQVICWNENIIY